MSPGFHHQNKAYNTCQIMVRLRDSHESYPRSKHYEISKKLFGSRMQEGTSVEKHVTDMIACIDRLASLDIVMDVELYIDLILHSLPDSWSDFIMNYKMLNEKKNFGELMQMLKEAEPEINKKTRLDVHLHESSKRKKSKCKKKIFPSYLGGIRKSQGKVPLQKMVDRSEDVCLYCGEKGHWKRDCGKYKTDLENENQRKTIVSGL